MSRQGRVSVHQTKDGSHSLYSETFSQFYHNPNGAVEESLHVFFEKTGLIKCLESGKNVSVLEIGFGTGLNLILLADLAQKLGSSSKIRFESIEGWPISPADARKLNYGEFIKTPALMDSLFSIFDKIEDGQTAAQKVGPVDAVVHHTLFDDFVPVKEYPAYNFIFHDPFSPEVNSELWQPNVFSKIKAWSSKNAVLGTYCAATSARAAMAVAGWKPYRERGALGKREMTIATAGTDFGENAKPLNAARLVERWENGEFAG